MATVSASYSLSAGASNWTSINAIPVAKKDGNSGSTNKWSSFSLAMGGDDGTTAVSTVYQYNRLSWSTISALSFTGLTRCYGCDFNGIFYLTSGTNNAGTFTSDANKLVVSWSSFTYPMTAAYADGGAGWVPSLGFMFFTAGRKSDGTVVDETRQMNAAESATTLGALGLSTQDLVAGVAFSKFYKLTGSTDGTAANSSATMKSWNGSAVGNETSAPAARSQAMFNGAPNGFYFGGGINTAGTAQTTYYFWNGTSFATVAGYPTATSQGQGGSI